MGTGLTPAARARTLNLERVTEALDAAAYRVTLMRDGVGINFTRPDKDGPEQLLHPGELAEKLSELARRNASGWNVYVTPLDPRHHYLVIDDIRGKEGLEAVRERGYRPALIQESSPGNYQAILRVPKDPSDPNEREAANAWVRTVNRELGDEKFTGAVHPFRLAGFTNRKEQYEQPNGHFPFVRLVETSGGDCPVASAELEAYRSRLPLELRSERSERSGEIVASDRWTPTGIRTAEIGAEPGGEGPHSASEIRREAPSASALERYIAHRSDVEAQVHRRGWVPDESRIDFEVARRMLKEAFPVQEVAVAIEIRSPDLNRRHPDTWGYASATATRAQDELARIAQGRRIRDDGTDIDR